MVCGITTGLWCSYSKAQPDLHQCLQYQFIKFAKVFGGPFDQNTKLLAAECKKRCGEEKGTGASTVTNLVAK